MLVLLYASYGCAEPLPEEPLSPVPLAVDDAASTQLNESVVIDVLANDIGFTELPVITIESNPESGTVVVNEDQTLSYTPGDDFIGSDSLFYSLQLPGEEVLHALVSIDTQCEACMAGSNVKLGWTANAPEQQVVGYRLYLNKDGDAEESMELFDDVANDSDDFDAENPQVQYDTWEDLRLMDGDTACFRLTAYNNEGESGFSNAACATMDKSLGKADIAIEF